ncbi:MAG: diaminopimelate decarboxylase [Paludibacteraceae bacterium]|nr:diaminopimelate decarboxylase [Paludibacteraceae bacterium]
MMTGNFPVNAFGHIETPFYYYDMDLLRKTLETIKAETSRYGFEEHYAVKANANPRILQTIASYGFGADCVSGGEIEAALEAGFPADKIVYAGVGKSDKEIRLGLTSGISCFNVESEAELLIIEELAAELNCQARVALRVNPNVDAHTHAKITTGLKENKFGINLEQLESVLKTLKTCQHLQWTGLHFHIGSQITDMTVFQSLVIRVMELQDELEAKGYTIANLNFGGGLGIDYQHPNHLAIADFEGYFKVFHQLVKRRNGQGIHFELGRAVVAPCGSLISRVLYVKEGVVKRFAILDAGMTDLVRPAMYDSYHRIENLNGLDEEACYDVVGPICESSDVFGKDRMLSKTSRGDLMALRSAGAYGEVMASQYNRRPLAKAYFSDQIH